MRCAAWQEDNHTAHQRLLGANLALKIGFLLLFLRDRHSNGDWPLSIIGLPATIRPFDQRANSQQDSQRHANPKDEHPGDDKYLDKP
jgi:hypothetical protein